MIRMQVLVAALVALGSPALAGPTVELKVRTLGGEWQTSSSASGKVTGGKAGSGVLLDGLSVAIPGVKTEMLPFIQEMNPSRSWKTDGQPAGIAGKKLEGFRLKVDKGSIRYRGSFAGVGLSDWTQDGAPVGGPGGGIFLEAVEVEYRTVSAADAPVEFRAAFRGQSFTPWLPVGSTAAGKGEKPALTAFEVRSGFHVRYEVCYPSNEWQGTTNEGYVAGYPGGDHNVEAIRIFSESVRVGYRVKLAGRDWSPWCYGGEACGEPGSGLRIEAIQIAREAATSTK